MNYLCTILYRRSRLCDELSHICTIGTKCVSNRNLHSRRQEKKKKYSAPAGAARARFGLLQPLEPAHRRAQNLAHPAWYYDF